jgi:phospholipid/cholesterol/gamma-HCH transport system ATP-binding protein
LEHTRLADSTIDEVVLLKLAQVGLVHFGAFYPSQLSGGMLKRASVARATAMDPEILFFDEPFAGLDPITAAGIDELVVYLKNALQMTVLIVTHELQSAFRIADRLAFLKDGKLVAIGSKDLVLQSSDPWVRQFLDRVPNRSSEDKTEFMQQLAGRLGIQCPKN